MNLILENLSGFWFVLGFLLLAIEILAFGFTSGVLLFGSLGALATGALLYFGVINANWLISIASFGLASAAATLLLWLPFKKMQSGAQLGNDKSSDLIGYKFRLPTDLTHTEHSATRYSGIEWRVELVENAEQTQIGSGSLVRVAAVNAGVFYVDAVDN